MTILRTLPDGTVERMPNFPPPTPPTGTFGATDPTYDDTDIRAVVTVRVAMTRDMLAAALDLFAGGAYDEHPDGWTVPYIRESVEMTLTHESVVQIEVDAERFPQLLDDPSVADRVRAEYRAIDRAYPHFAPKES
ncbi:hypothetical protein J7E96_35320 [Streptomyces sp. ISL-96]|uniref:hypothetical protein n=1 Tax=Streptomyces sp. ISL-96 TaxID=2819191 RepID=UPI001BE513D4|nr:hypothetical protein [Streptomyces sp. ISL-96]MBT2493682.1 hypothetical protein [Streptomyces sp. ISL-96]